METLNKIEAIIKRDGGQVNKINLFANVLIIRVTKKSLPQITRFAEACKSLKSIKGYNIEEKENELIFSTALLNMDERDQFSSVNKIDKETTVVRDWLDDSVQIVKTNK